MAAAAVPPELCRHQGIAGVEDIEVRRKAFATVQGLRWRTRSSRRSPSSSSWSP